MSPSTTSSSTPVTVIVWATFQSAEVKLRNPRSGVPSPGSLELTAIRTSAVGWLVSTTVNVAVPAASVVISPVIGVTVKPATSLSVFVAKTSLGSNVL